MSTENPFTLPREGADGEPRTYIVFDARSLVDTDRAAVLCACDSLSEAIEVMDDVGAGVVYSYAEAEGKLIDKRHEFTHPDLAEVSEDGEVNP